MTWNHLPWQRPASYDDRPCVRDDRTALTYRAFGERVEAVAEQLAARGVGAGSVVAVMLPNRVELLVTIMAAWRLGAAATPVNPTFTAAEADHQLGDAGAVLLVASEPGTRHDGVVVLDVHDLATVPARTLAPPETRPSDLALLVYTSGSTGRPKGVMLDHANVAAMIDSMGEAIAVGPDDHCLLVLPLFHVNAICVSFLTPMSAGAQLTVLQRFHPVEFLAAIEEHRPTYFSAVPTIYSHLVALPEEVRADVSSVRFAICGAAPAPPALLAAVERRFGFPLVEGYGLSEGTCASTCNPVDGLRKPGTVGPALPGQLVAVMAPDGTLASAGERGEVVIKGANVMRGYLGRPEATAAALGDGWLHTGDVGILDEDGYLRIVDRIKDMIIRGGENIGPAEIEQVLEDHPGVAEAAVIGVPDVEWGEIVKAILVPAGASQPSPEDLTEYVKTRLASYKAPAYYTYVKELPRNHLGKILKTDLRQEHGKADGLKA